MKKAKLLDDYINKYKEKLKKKYAMKKELKQRKLFILNKDYILSILENRIKPIYPYIQYELRKADNTNSYYIKFTYNNTYLTARISDHESYVGALGIVVTNKTSKDQVVAALKERIKALLVKNKARAFQQIEKEL